jgi:hypothetical protein
MLLENTLMTLNDPTNKIKSFYSIKPINFPILVGISVFQEKYMIGEPPSINIEFVLSKKARGDPQRLIINFKDVTNFKFMQPNSSLLQLTQIEITSIKDRQWETANYKVTEAEENIFSLICKDFDAIIKD